MVYSSSHIKYESIQIKETFESDTFFLTQYI